MAAAATAKAHIINVEKLPSLSNIFRQLSRRGSKTNLKPSSDVERAAMFVLRWHRRRDEARKQLRVTRVQLIDRLQLEIRLVREFRVFVQAVVMFIVLIWTLLISRSVDQQLGLVSSYRSMLRLGEVAELTTAPQLKSFLAELSSQASQLLPLSDVYFTEQRGELRVVSGVRTYQQTERVIPPPGLNPWSTSPDLPTAGSDWTNVCVRVTTDCDRHAAATRRWRVVHHHSVGRDPPIDRGGRIRRSQAAGRQRRREGALMLGLAHRRRAELRIRRARLRRGWQRQ